MARLALVVAFGAMVAAGLPSPGLFAALGLGLAAVGLGWVGFRKKGSPGRERLAGAAAMTVGVIGCLLGAARVAMALTALDHISRLLG